MLSVPYRLRGLIASLFGNLDWVATDLLAPLIEIRWKSHFPDVCENFYLLRRELPRQGIGEEKEEDCIFEQE
jgi:hypothetical protein